ncbi:thioesterase family protein [Verrucomicrobiia bacterium DG1235]|nr:thioesterase family protein [Verrucomicrobiae bacterium DG1235]
MAEVGHSSVIELDNMRQLGHSSCLACTHPDLKLDFALEGPNVIRCAFDFTKEMTSFNGYVHGGLQALVLDQAMTCALMAQGIFGATGDLNLRYKRSVEVGPSVCIRAWVEKRFHSMYYLRAELLQGGNTCTLASARFVEKELEA